MAIYNDILTLTKANELAGLNLWPTTITASANASTVEYLVVAGGGGGGGNPSPTGSGGSGIVYLKYPESFFAASNTVGSPNVTVAGGYRIYRFWQSGSITF